MAKRRAERFAKKFVGLGRDSAGGALASVLRKHSTEGRTPDGVEPCVRHCAGLALQGGQGLAAPIQNDTGCACSLPTRSAMVRVLLGEHLIWAAGRIRQIGVGLHPWAGSSVQHGPTLQTCSTAARFAFIIAVSVVRNSRRLCIHGQPQPAPALHGVVAT
jgi:hypothetical protein